MPRLSGTGNENLKSQIRKVLSQNEKLYLTQIANLVHKRASTVRVYLKKFMVDEVELAETVGTKDHKLVTYYKLRK